MKIFWKIFLPLFLLLIFVNNLFADDYPVKNSNNTNTNYLNWVFGIVIVGVIIISWMNWSVKDKKKRALVLLEIIPERISELTEYFSSSDPSSHANLFLISEAETKHKEALRLSKQDKCSWWNIYILLYQAERNLNRVEDFLSDNFVNNTDVH